MNGVNPGWGNQSWGNTIPLMPPAQGAPALPYAPTLPAIPAAARLRIMEVTAHIAPTAIRAMPLPWGSMPWGSEGTMQHGGGDILFRASDIGYVDETHTPYPPLMSDGIDLSRALTLSADAMGGSLSIGTVELTNAAQQLDTVIARSSIDHMPVTILHGRRQMSVQTGQEQDPPRSDLIVLFSGLAKNWAPGLNTVSLQMLDATYWLDGSMPVATYGGGGKLDGDSNVKGKNMPRLRGVVCNITPVLIDSVNYVYQISDGPASITALYEGGYAGGIQCAGTVADIYAASPSPGTYTMQTGASGTWIRLGTKPVYAITLDAVGQFRSGASMVNVLDLLRQMLLEDLGVPATYIDPAWPQASTLAPYRGGWYWDGSERLTGRSITTTLLQGLGISLVPTRRGTLMPVQMEVPGPYVRPVMEITTDLASNVQPVTLDTSLDPPTWRWRIGYQHNFTVQGSGSKLHPQATADRLALVAQQDRMASWVDTRVRESYRVPNDPDLTQTALASEADALSVVTHHGLLWGVQRRLWAVDIPQDYALLLDLGDPVRLRLPVPGLRAGVPGIVVGEHINATELTTTLTILV